MKDPERRYVGELPGSWTPEKEEHLGHVINAVVEMQNAAMRLGSAFPSSGAVVPLAGAADVATIYRAARGIERKLPSVEAWCVVKHYAHEEPGEHGAWKPSVWIGCLTEEQAKAMRDALATYYDAEANRHGWKKDNWVVELRPCRVQQLLAPSLSPREYMRSFP